LVGQPVLVPRRIGALFAQTTAEPVQDFAGHESLAEWPTAPPRTGFHEADSASGLRPAEHLPRR